MAGGAAEPVLGRRYFVSMAVNRHKELPPDEQLTRSSSDAECLADLLATFGYERALRGMGNYWTAEHVRSSLSGWSKDAALGADDVVVFYFAGHGLVADRDRHYLMCWDSSDDDPAATALATEDLVRILTRTGLRNLLVVLDTCYGGTGAADGAQLVLRTISRQLNNDGSGGVWLLSSARAKDEAGDGTFMESLLPALHEVRERTGQRQRFLDLIDVVDSVNQRFRKLGLRQRAELAAGMVTGLAPFLDNVGFRHNLPAEDTDLELQRLLVKRDLHDHFGPRARGVEFDSEPGLYFHGRRRILAELVAWLVADSPDGKGRVVTGTPGCGKSAVVGRIVAMSDPAYRRSLLYETDPAGTRVPPGIVQAAVHSRHKLLPEIVQQIASAIGAEVDGPGQLLREISLRARDGGPLVIVVDALDEAGSGTAADAGGKGEPRRIARELLRPMSEIPGVRLLVGTRAELVSSLGASFQVLNLDNDGYLGEDDIAEYVTKLLLAENEPEVMTPYRGRFELARTVGDAVAGRAAGVFLVARMTARGLRSSDDVMDVSRPNWEEDLPSEIGEAFELDSGAPGEMLEAAVVAGLASAGADVHRYGWSTIPSLAYQVVQSGADLGVMISVPRGQVGQVKVSFFGADGYGLPAEIEDEIEVAHASASVSSAAASGPIGRVTDSRDAGDGYVAHLLTSVPRPLEGLRVVLDCPAGAVVTFASAVYRRAGVDLAAIQTAPREDDQSVSLRRLQDAVRDHKADLGITHDSEGRRCLFVDGNGETVDGDQITAVLALALADSGKLANHTVVTTVMSNLGLHLAMRAHGVTVVTTAVGERYVMQELRAGRYSLGGDPFGAIVLPDHSTTSDGLLTALLLMSRVVSTGRSLAELASVMHRLPQVLVNVPVHDKTAVVNSAEVRDAVEKTNLELGDHGRVLIRPSGAEQLVRVMVEAAEEGTAQTAAERLAAVISSAPESPMQEHPAT